MSTVVSLFGVLILDSEKSDRTKKAGLFSSVDTTPYGLGIVKDINVYNFLFHIQIRIAEEVEVDVVRRSVHVLKVKEFATRIINVTDR